MVFSIIIPTYNRNLPLSKCLDKLSPGTQHLDPSLYEVIVSDDSPNEETEKFCKENYHWVRYTKGFGKGPAANRNNGMKLARNKWLVFIDDDCIPDKLLLKEYANFITENSHAVVVEGATFPLGSQTAFNQECPINIVGGHFWSCNICIRKDIFSELNGFDEKFPYAAMEDIDLSMRLRERHKIFFCSNAKVYHPWKMILHPFERFDVTYRAHIIFLQKWPEQGTKFGIASAFIKILGHMKNSLFSNFISFKGRGMQYILAYYLFLIKLSIYQLKRGVF